MSISVRMPAAMRGLTGGLAKVPASGNTVGAVMDDLESRFAGIRRALCDAQGRPLRFVAIFVNGTDARTLRGMETAVAPDAEIDIVCAIAGG